MKKSYAFEAVSVILLMGLIGLLYFAIASTPHVDNAWEKKANGSVDYMFAGSDDMLYIFSSNDITAFSKDGNRLWQLDMPSDWKILNNWTMPEYQADDNGYMGRMFNSYPIVGESDGSLYLFEMQAINDTDVKMAGSNITQKYIGNDSYASPEIPYISKSCNVMKISPGGRIEWKYSFVTNLSTWYIGGLVLPGYYEMQRPIAISVHGDRIFLYHDYTEDVLDSSGMLLFSINNVSAPVAVDGQGDIYTVRAVKPTEEQFNESIVRNYSIKSDVPTYISMAISDDLTFMLTTGSVEAYSPDGSLLWTRDIGINATRPYVDEQVWPYYNTLPLFSNDSLYVPVYDGIVKLGLDGNVDWARYVNDDGYTLFPLMPVDSHGNIYMAKIGQNPLKDMLTAISPDGQASNITWPYSDFDDISYDPGMVPVGGNEGVVYAYRSIGHDLYNMSASAFSDTLASHHFSAYTIVAYDVARGKDLWSFTIPDADVHVVTLNKDNAANALLWDASVFGGPTHPNMMNDVRVYASRNVTYVNYYYSVFEAPVVYNQSRCMYVRSIYALDNNGSLLWSKDMNGFVDKMAAGNSTIYYSLDNGRIGGSGVNVVAGIAVAAIVYMFLRFFMLGTVTRARKQLDGNRNRRSLFQYIVEHPGVTAADMAKDLGINMGTIRYHLFILSLNHRVVIHRDNSKFLRYFKNSGAYTDSEKVLVSMIRRKPLQKIVHVLIEKEKLSGPDLAKELNISDKAIYRHIAELQEKDIIEKFQGNDRNIVYSIKVERLDQIKQLMSRF